MPAAMKFSVADVRHAHIREKLGEAAWLATLERLDPEDRAIVERGTPDGMAPASVEGRLMESLALAVFHGDRAATERFLREGGRAQADKMLDGVFSIFARFASPTQALKRAPSIFSSVYVGTTADSEVAADGRSGVLRVHGLGEYTFVGPWLSGWMERAIERFGGVAPTVRERSWEAGMNGSDELTFEARWG